MHYKTDLLNDAEMAHFTTQAGDTLSLSVPDGRGGHVQAECLVTAVEIADAGKHPETGEHLTRVTLELT